MCIEESYVKAQQESDQLQTSEEMKSSDTFNLDLWPPELCETLFLLFMLPSLWYLVIIAAELLLTADC